MGLEFWKTPSSKNWGEKYGNEGERLTKAI